MAGAETHIRGMRVLVTGAAGFIGSHLCERLARDGHGVWGLDNFDTFYDPAIKRRNVSEVAGHPLMRIVEGDVRDTVLLDGLMSAVPFDLVVHLAARPGVAPSVTQPELCYDVNVMGTLRLLEAMRRHRVGRLVFASSAAVYAGSAEADGGIPETAPADRPTSPYAASKRSGELACHVAHRLWGLSAHCLRFFTVYGPRQRPDLAITKFARLLEARERIPVYGDGSSRRDYVFVDDVVEGVCRSADQLQERPAGEPAFDLLNLGRGRSVGIEEVVDELAAAMNVRPRIARKAERAGDMPFTMADTTRVSAVLGFRPGIDLPDGLRRYVEWRESVEAATETPILAR